MGRNMNKHVIDKTILKQSCGKLLKVLFDKIREMPGDNLFSNGYD